MEPIDLNDLEIGTTICEKCCRCDDWNWKCEHETCKFAENVPLTLYANNPEDAEKIKETLKVNPSLLINNENDNIKFSPPLCENCKCNDKWYCVDWITFPTSDVSNHKCMCGNKITKEFPINMNANLIMTDTIKTYIRSDFSGIVPSLDQVINNAKLCNLQCNYPNCSNKIKVLKYVRATVENISGGVQISEKTIKPNDNTYLLAIYYIDGSCKITDSDYGPYHRLDFCNDHKSEANQPDNLFLVMDRRDISSIGADHVLKYQCHTKIKSDNKLNKNVNKNKANDVIIVESDYDIVRSKEWVEKKKKKRRWYFF